MTEEKLVLIQSGDEQIGVMVAPGDRVDVIGNVWGHDGIWKCGPGFEQPPMAAMPPLDDPLLIDLTEEQVTGMFDLGWSYDLTPKDAWEWCKGAARGGDATWAADLAMLPKLTPPFDDPVPDFKVEGEVSATFDNPEIWKQMQERAEGCPGWLPPDLFDGLVEAVSVKLDTDTANKVDNDFTTEQHDGMVALGWEYLSSPGDYWFWKKGEFRERGASWLDDLAQVNEKIAEDMLEDELIAIHSKQIESMAADMLSAIHLYCRTINQAETEGFRVGVTVTAEVDG